MRSQMDISFFNGKDITEESPAERARDGIFLSFQNPIEVPGITLGKILSVQHWSREPEAVSDSGTFVRN